MKTLLSFLALTLVGCATSSQVDQLQDKVDKMTLRVEEVRLEQQAQFCAMSMVPCILVTQDKLTCSVMVTDCSATALEVYKKNTGKDAAPESLNQLLNEIKQSSQQQQKQPRKQQEDNGL